MSTLVIVRHGQSEGNERNEFTGWKNAPLTNKGRKESREAGERIAAIGISFDAAFCSGLVRSIDTCRAILRETQADRLELSQTEALNERDYGELTGMNKDEARDRWGSDLVQEWRRSYRTRPPGGESISDTSARVLPFLLCEVIPLLLRGRMILLVAHGNSLRVVRQAIDRLTTEQMLSIETPTAVPTIYRIGTDLTLIDKCVLTGDDR
ncbi:2,3-bisphosphoglycerate-dependent phosphoglycerate mutase [Rhizobium lentis]|uniref:2,3-bisphosphoglycerate-dependent phosphoglycerate mutase n=1 Tax=Rhizobium lentis TaxID=1138194 RepID=A0ABS7I8K1_9HYPH|nr:2,3-bisphosphoglycerate-dependent phosphoglycerate mutase [Rhizobium lentis]MBX5088165.1 2,3-bisphosphoglycerate-dependent phosphoglycerate mutase [Rhizobium lentis]MBX5101384.1 2,3-bisphosphoglycerate-dependent phosphoglycerate mutase [Rhizobium lentis]